MQFFDDANFSWRILAVESVVIMLSVLLGFVLNGWRESAREQETVDAALQSIAAEAQRNRDRLERQLPYFREMNSTLDSLSHTSDETHFVNPLAREEASAGVPGWGGLQMNPLSTFSYQSASSAGVFSHMDYGLAERISSIRLLQDSYLGAQDNFLKASLSDDLDSVNKLAIVFGLRARLAERLVDEYNALLSTLSERRGVSVPTAAPDSTR